MLAGCNEITSKDLVQRRDGLTYLKGERLNPYTGPYIAYYPAKKIVNEDGEEEEEEPLIYQTGTYINGLKEGTWTTYKWNGSRREDKYIRGRKNGGSIWFHVRSNKKSRTVEFIDGREEGGSTYYDKKGQVTKNEYYDNGARIPYPRPEGYGNK